MEVSPAKKSRKQVKAGAGLFRVPAIASKVLSRVGGENPTFTPSGLLGSAASRLAQAPSPSISLTRSYQGKVLINNNIKSRVCVIYFSVLSFWCSVPDNFIIKIRFCCSVLKPDHKYICYVRRNFCI